MDEEKFDRHINRTEKFEIDGDEFVIKPLGFKNLGKLWKLLRKMSSVMTSETVKGELSKEETAKMMETMDENTVDLVLELEVKTMKKSYPKLSDEKAQEFCAAHMFEILPAMIAVNLPNEHKR